MRKTMTLLAALALACGEPTTTEGDAPSSSGEASAASAAEEDEGPVLARVGDVTVTAKEFEAAASRKTPENGTSLSMEEKKEVLDRLVDQKALYLAAKERGIDRDPKVQKVMINTLLREDVYASVRNSDFSPEELQAYFEEHRDEFIVPEKVQIKRILVKITPERDEEASRERAKEVLAKLKADRTKFKELAAKYSDDPYKRRGGDLGFLSREGKPGIDPAVVEKAFQMKVGELSEIFKAGGGFNIVTVANHREEVVRTFEQMRGSVLRKVKNEKYKSLYESYVEDVRGKYEVNIDQEELASVDVAPAAAPPGFPFPRRGGMEARPRPTPPPKPGTIRAKERHGGDQK